MSEGGAESASEENSDTKADFFERGGRRKYICKHSGSSSLPPTLTFSLIFYLFIYLF